MKFLWLSILLVLVGAVPGAAQTRTPTTFLTGGVFGAIEQFGHVSLTDSGRSVPDASGTTLGGTVGIGTFLNPRFSVRLEFAFPGTLENTETSTTSAGPVTSTDRLQIEERIRTGSVLGAYHTATGRRVQVAYLGGIAFAQRWRRLVSETTINIPVPPSFDYRNETTSVSYGTDAIVGIDAAVQVSPRFAIVPQLRAHGLGGGVSIRPGVTARWSF